MCGLDLSGLGWGQLTSASEHGNNLWGSIKWRRVSFTRGTIYLLMKDFYMQLDFKAVE
jgi:hypothetical protein